MMKIEIVVTDKKRGEYRIPITRKEASAMYDAGFMIASEEEETGLIHSFFEPNGITEPFFSLHEKFLHLVNDVIYDGKCSTMTEDGKIIPIKKKFWLKKKPRWSNEK